MIIAAVVILGLYSIVLTILFLRCRGFIKSITSNKDVLGSWLKIHRELERTASAVIEVRKLDKDSIFYREPTQ